MELVSYQSNEIEGLYIVFERWYEHSSISIPNMKDMYSGDSRYSRDAYKILFDFMEYVHPNELTSEEITLATNVMRRYLTTFVKTRKLFAVDGDLIYNKPFKEVF